MTIDEVKDYLNQVQDADKMIQLKQKQLKELNAQKYAIGGQDYSKDRVQTSTAGDSIQRLIVKIVDLEKEIKKDIDYFIDLKAKIMRQIDSLHDADDKVFLYAKYFEYKKHSQISAEMGYCERNIVKIHKRALSRLSEILN